MQRDDVIRIIREGWAELTALGVTSLSLFGSVARGEAREESDVDLLVEFDGRPMGYFGFFEVQERLEQMLGARVDLVPRRSVRPALRDRIFAEEVNVT